MNRKYATLITNVAHSHTQLHSLKLAVSPKSSIRKLRTLRRLACAPYASLAPVLRLQECHRSSVEKPAASDAATGYRSFNLLSFDLPLVRLRVIIPKLARGVGHFAPVFGQAGNVFGTHSGQDLQGLQIRRVAEPQQPGSQPLTSGRKSFMLLPSNMGEESSSSASLNFQRGKLPVISSSP